MAGFSNTTYVAAENAMVSVIHNWETVPLYTQAVGNYVQRFLAVEVCTLCRNPLRVC